MKTLRMGFEGFWGGEHVEIRGLLPSPQAPPCAPLCLVVPELYPL